MRAAPRYRPSGYGPAVQDGRSPLRHSESRTAPQGDCRCGRESWAHGWKSVGDALWAVERSETDVNSGETLLGTRAYMVCLSRIPACRHAALERYGCSGGRSDHECGLLDAQADLRIGLVSAGAEQDVLAGGVNVAETALQRMVCEYSIGAGQPEHRSTRGDGGAGGGARRQQQPRPLLQAWLVAPARRCRISAMESNKNDRAAARSPSACASRYCAAASWPMLLADGPRVLVVAMAANSSSALRAIPSGTAARYIPACVMSGIRHSGPSCRAGSKNGAASCRAGTCMSVSDTWWLPVPRRPIASQLSSITTDLAGMKANRQSGAPDARTWGAAPSAETNTPTWSQSA